MTPEEISGRIGQVHAQLESDLESLHGEAALRAVNSAQRDLRDLRRYITDDEREIRLDATAQRQKATQRAQASSLFGKTASKAVHRTSAAQRTAISQSQNQAMARYSPLKAEIGELLSQWDRVKDAIKAGESPHLEPTNAQLARAAAAAPAEPAPPKSAVKALAWAIIWLIIALVLLLAVKGLFGGLVGAVLLVVGVVGLVVALTRWLDARKKVNANSDPQA